MHGGAEQRGAKRAAPGAGGLRLPHSISVVIPNLNSPTIDRTLASIRSERLDPAAASLTEVLVVGLDEPRLVHVDDLVRHIPTPVPTAPAKARNIGWRQAKGEIVAFIDADCLAEPGWLAELTAPFRDPSVTVVGGSVVFDAAGSYWTLADNLASFHEFLGDAPAGHRSHLASLNLALHHRALVEVGGFDERYPRPAGEDSDLSYRLRQAGHRLLFRPSAVVRHRPARSTPWALLHHAADFGRYSVKMRPHPGSGPGSAVLRRRPLLAALSPVAAAWATIMIFVRRPSLVRYAHTAPAVYLAKLAWCWGAVQSPEWVREPR